MESKIVKYTDSDGETISVLEVGTDKSTAINGLQEALPEIRNFKFKDDDILITTYPRSGTHLTWEIIRMLKNNSAEYIKGEKESEGLELFNRPGWGGRTDRVLNTHLDPSSLPVDIRNGKCKMVHVYRNPKDVMVSYYNHVLAFKIFYQYGGTFSGFYELAMRGEVPEGSWFEYELKYEDFLKNHPNVPALLLSFEDMVEEPIGSVRRISEFLGLSRDEKLFQEITEAVSFNKMKKAKLELKSNILKRGQMDEAGYNQMYRKGKSGDWKNWFTVAQNEALDAKFEFMMSESEIGSKIKWSVNKKSNERKEISDCSTISSPLT